MNVFRLAGDMIHLASIFLLLFKLTRSKSCVGVSARMQELYLIVFMTRYLDLFFHFVSVYNTVMKITFISSTAYLIYLMRFKAPINTTYDRSADNFSYEKFLLPPCLVLAFLTAEEWEFTEILWTFSIWLESVSIIPQLALLQKMREVENLTSDFVGAMGIYRALYILNWVYRFYTEGYVNWIGWVGGLIQTALYCDFFYYYVKSKIAGEKLRLPMAIV